MMDGDIEYNSDHYISTTESISQESVSISSYSETFYSPILEIKSGKNVSNSTKNENSHFTSTPNFFGSSNEECQNGGGINGKSSRVRKEECHRVHYTSDLDDSNLTYYEEKKRSKRRRMSLLQSLSTDEMDSEEVYLDTLENHLFPDMSFSETDLSYNSESKFNASKKTNLNWSKLQGVSYLGRFDFSGDELEVDCTINHPKRSIFRQKRRDWYLNRRNLQRKSHNTSLWWRYIRQFIQILFIVSTRMRKVSRKISKYVYLINSGISKSSCTLARYVSKPFILIFQLSLYIYTLLKTHTISTYSKILNVFITSSVKESVITESIIADDAIADNTIGENTVAEKEKIRFSCSYFLCWVILLFAILLAVFAGYYEEGKLSIVPIPNPTKSGIGNAYPMYLEVDNTKIPAWHIYPNLPVSSVKHPMKKSLTDMSPVMLLLRNDGAVDTPQLKSVYQTLSSLGYHVVVPTNILSQYEVLKAWKWIKTKTNATAYMWGYDMPASTLTSNAKLFCKYLIPPNGVIIAREIKTGILHQSMEIWSCNCVLTPDGDNNSTDFKYNHVKCPIAFGNNDSNDVYSQMVACIETVNKDVK